MFYFWLLKVVIFLQFVVIYLLRINFTVHFPNLLTLGKEKIGFEQNERALPEELQKPAELNTV